MKKIILLLAAIPMSISAFADEKSQVLLTALSQKVAGWGDYRVEFSVSIDSEPLAGSYEVSGASYRVETPDIDLFCDGTTRWEVNRLDREVAIDRVDPTDRTVMGNPTRLFDFLDGSYTHRYVGTALINGISCERIELRETALMAGRSSDTSGGSTAGQTIDVYLSTSTGLPVRVGYTIGLMSTQAAIDIVRITPRITLDRAAFAFNPARYTGFEIIDFR
jgi:outer membrane lipoprotein-sorting protein